MRTVPIALVLVVVAGACTSSGQDRGATTQSPGVTTTSAATTTTTAPDGRGGRVTMGTDTPVETLNPFAPNAFGGRVVGNAVWAMVYDIEPTTWERIPDAVTGLPSQTGNITINDDGTMTVRYEVRPGLAWSDGSPMTGEDIAFTARAMRDMALAGEGGVEPVMATVVSTDAVDRLGFVTFSEPTLAFEDALWIILPSHALENVDLVNGTDGSDWPSGGPFVVESFDPGRSVALERNDRYGRTDAAGEPLPYLDELVFTDVGADPISAFLARDVDVTPVDAAAASVAVFDEASPDGAVLIGSPSPVIEQITFQFDDRRLEVDEMSLNDVRDYREAIALSLDRDSLLRTTDVAWLPEVPGILVPIGTSAWERYPYDPPAGSRLVDAVRDGTPPRATLSTTGNDDARVRIGEALSGSFASIGVEYTPIFLDSVLFYGALPDGAFDLGMWAWANDGGFADTLDLMDVLDPATDVAGADYGRWSGEGASRFSEIVVQAHTTIDADEFRTLVEEAEDILATELPLIPLFDRGSYAAVWTDVVEGFVANGSPSSVTWNVEGWRRIGE